MSIFYCLCFVNDISTDMLEERVLGERDPDLYEEGDIKMTEIREENWRGVAEDDEDRINISALMWVVYTKVIRS